MKLPPKMPQRAMVRIWVASLHQKTSTYANTLRFLFCNKARLIERVDSNSCGAVAEDGAKTAQWAVFSSAARDIHPRPPRTPVSEPGTGVSVLSAVQKERKGGFEQQQRRPLPAAETGRSCWGCGQQDARAAQGTMQPLGAATRAPFLRGSRHPPAPAKNSSIRTGYWCFCFICYAKGM